MKALLPALLLLLSACGGSSESTETIDPAEVVREARSFEDTSRSTSPNGDFAGSTSRLIGANLWYAPRQLDAAACSDSGCGLVLLAHGFGGNPDRFDIIARSLAARGWIVAAIRFPLTNDQAPGGFSNAITDVLSQPGDVTFLLDQLARASAEGNGPLAGRIDLTRIGVIGHSLGGATTLALDRYDCCSDPRIGANFMVAPATMILSIFGDPGAQAGGPILISVGTADPIIPPSMMRDYLVDAPGPWTLAVMQDYDHVTHVEASDIVPFPGRIEETARLAHAFFLEVLVGESALDAVLEDLRTAGHEVSAG